MHILMFGDQHVETSGGAQVSMRLQRRFLEKAGHTVTIVAPAMHGPRVAEVAPDAAFLDLPSIPITLDREYAMTWPGRRADAHIDRAVRGRPPVDVVHVQADFWGAMLGHRFATGHGLPVVHTMHNRVDVGLRAVTPLAGIALRVLNAWQRRSLSVGREARPVGQPAGHPVGHDGWAYLRRFAVRSQAVTAPSAHFARRLEQHGAVPAAEVVWNGDRLERGAARGIVDVVWNGIDDAILDAGLDASSARPAREPGVARLIWIGRMSPEKRLLPFLEALAESGISADVEIVGGGGQLAAARRLVRKRRPTASVTFVGRLPYAETLRRIAAADAVVQTSVGFETQGMTVFEAASLGTRAIICDPDIAAELGSGVWTVGSDARAGASVTALAAALRRAADDIAAGTAPAPDPSIAERFRQSSRTAAMLEVYRRAIEAS
ncbi:glycosyltransferase [uncultured Microbacterium sp.]|uniref:glycosyltransferase n=1 Tax=uncultured Microbacterium sp. TaxID=191216 RepID=UPI0035CBACE4